MPLGLAESRNNSALEMLVQSFTFVSFSYVNAEFRQNGGLGNYLSHVLGCRVVWICFLAGWHKSCLNQALILLGLVLFAYICKSFVMVV